MFDSLLISTAWAQEAAAGAAPHPSVLEQAFPYVMIFLVMFYFFLRPQQKKAQKHSEFLTGIKRGDSVLTTGGILGTIEGLTEKFVILQIADNVKIRVLKTQVASGVTDELVKK